MARVPRNTVLIDIRYVCHSEQMEQLIDRMGVFPLSYVAKDQRKALFREALRTVLTNLWIVGQFPNKWLGTARGRGAFIPVKTAAKDNCSFPFLTYPVFVGEDADKPGIYELLRQQGWVSEFPFSIDKQRATAITPTGKLETLFTAYPLSAISIARWQLLTLRDETEIEHEFTLRPHVKEKIAALAEYNNIMIASIPRIANYGRSEFSISDLVSTLCSRSSLSVPVPTSSLSSAGPQPLTIGDIGKGDPTNSHRSHQKVGFGEPRLSTTPSTRTQSDSGFKNIVTGYPVAASMFLARRQFGYSSWDATGRLISGFHNMERKHRAKVTIDGLPVFEVDISGCHCILAYARKKLAAPAQIYPISAAFDKRVLKAVNTIALNNNTRRSAVLAIKDYLKKEFQPPILLSDMQIDQAISEWLSYHKPIESLFFVEHRKIPLGCEFQTIEGELGVLVAKSMHAKGHVVLNMHDGFMAAADARVDQDLRDCISEAFEKLTNVKFSQTWLKVDYCPCSSQLPGCGLANHNAK